ncbi:MULTISPECIES: hypothetical protein [Sinorhizobium]|nr:MULTISPECIES: hypothetical protein [Sinorhizobium]POH34927.1 hypothetical protein ATY31_05070 [Sinorhizobium americanum]
MKVAAREGVARAEREFMLRPENSRAAYLGAVGLAALGELDRAKEWAARAWPSIGTTVWPNTTSLAFIPLRVKLIERSTCCLSSSRAPSMKQ